MQAGKDDQLVLYFGVVRAQKLHEAIKVRWKKLRRYQLEMPILTMVAEREAVL